MKFTLSINGQSHQVDVSPETPLLWVLRDHLHLTGTKFGCGLTQCGACTVHIDGVAMRSCVYPVSTAVGKTITTIEGLSDKAGLAIQLAWQEHQVTQCGYCQSGQIMTAASLLRNNPNPSDEQIDSIMSGNICRCATYPRIRAAIKTAAKHLGA
jgi:isoquinoline 1-oxidoreductase alpha subunit